MVAWYKLFKDATATKQEPRESLFKSITQYDGATPEDSSVTVV